MRVLVLISIQILLLSPAFGQSVLKTPVRGNVATSYPIDGTPILQSHYQQAAKYILAHPRIAQQMKPEKATTWNFSVGTTRSWWVSNLATDAYYLDASTCRAVGKHCYIFVEDSMWTSGKVNQNAVDSIRNDFDNKTPANAGNGIFAMDSSAFGAPPNVDGDPKIIILICNIQEGFTGTGGYVAGFFDPNQEVPDGATPGARSNHAEIYYIDANPTDLTTASGIQLAMSTAAHEFQHMINFNYNSTNPEPTFVNEGCSKLAEVYCGYPTSDLSLYANETNHYLFDWRRSDNTLVLNDYARAQRFFLYIWDRFGIGIFKSIVQTSQTGGVPILTSALSSAGTSTSFNDLFTDWLVANELDDTTSNRLYGYTYSNLPASNGKTFFNPTTSGKDTIQNLGAEYLIFKGGSNLSITFTNTGGNSNLVIKAIEIGNSTKKVVDVPFGAAFAEPDYGTIYSSVAFVVLNKAPNNSAVFSYQATGNGPAATTELKWDATEPTGYYPWAMSDTVCVTFDAYPGGILDSVRIALRRAGSITGGVYQFTGVQNPTPLGKLLTPITATISTTSSVPYLNPYQNWAGVALTSKNIGTDKAFAVAFVIGPVDTIPGVMVTDYPGQNPYHSYTYLSADEGSDGAGWYYITSSNTTVAIYLVRAYVSFPTSGVVKTINPAPDNFELYQNYPNPFNPTTVIRYHLSAVSLVTLKVYDVLGREVRTLVNERQSPGNHSVTFDAGNLTSGIYFYRVSANGVATSRKMLLVK